jgi:hypothetical protein
MRKLHDDPKTNLLLNSYTSIETDLEREIGLAKATRNAENIKQLESMGIRPGAGNFLCALGLLCYTEFLGSEKYNHAKMRGKGKNKRQISDNKLNFLSLFKDLGEEYRIFAEENSDQIWNYRNGFTHDYVYRGPSIVSMLKPNGLKCGVFKKDDILHFNVQKYYEDLSSEFYRYSEFLLIGANVSTRVYPD